MVLPLTILFVDRPGVSLHLPTMSHEDDDARPIGPLERRCPVRTAIGVISGKWKPTILLAIVEGHGRYAEIRRRVPGINDQALARQLRQLRADGVVERIADDAGYRLTPLGSGLAAIMTALEQWGDAYLDRRFERTKQDD